MFWMIFVTAVAIIATVLVFWISASSRFDGRAHVVRGLVIATLFWVLIARTIAHIFVNWLIFSPITTWWVILLLVFFLVAAFFLGGRGLMGWAVGAVVVAMLISVIVPIFPLVKGKYIELTAKPVAQVQSKSVAQVACEKKHGKLDSSSGLCFITQFTPAKSLLNQVPANCVGGHNVVLDSNVGNRIISAGVSSDPHQAVRDIMRAAGEDPRVLQAYWNQSPLAKNSGGIANVNQLVDTKTGCYTQAAANDYERLVAVYETATTVKTVIPAYFVNTGASPKGGVFQEAGVSGSASSRAGFTTRFSNGDSVSYLRRCANLVSPAPMATIPLKQTPVTTTTTTTTTTTPTPTSTPTPQRVKICYKVSCGPNGVNAPPVQSGNPGGTPNYKPGTAETVTGAQTPPANPYSPNPTYGSNPPAGSVAPSGADNGIPSGGSAGVSAPSGTPNPGGGTAQPSTAPAGSSGPSGNPCFDPNAPGCSH